jgi:hypothetical protein
MRMGRGSRGCAAFALATVFAASGAAQTPEDSSRPKPGATETIAANDTLAGTAGPGTSGDAQSSGVSPAPALGQSVPPPASTATSTMDRLTSWMGVESDNVRWLRLGSWEGSVGFTYGGTRQEFGGSGTASPASTTQIATQYVNVRNQGFSILDPRLITGNIGVTLGLDQVKQQSGDIGQTQRGTLDGYAFDATFFGQKALNAKVWADREQGYSTLSFGGNTKTTISSAGAALNLFQSSWLRDAEILPFFDATLQAFQQHTLQQYDFGGVTSADDQIRNVVRFDANNGTETSDLHLHLEYVDFQYPTFTTGSYQSHGASVFYSGDFGANLDMTWNSVIGYDDRVGDIPLQTATISQSLDVFHNSDLRSTYAYNLYQQDSNGLNIVNQNASANVVYTLWRNLTMTASAIGASNRYPNGTVRGATGSVGIDYSRVLPCGGQVFGSAQGSYAHVSDNLATGEVPVIDQAYSAPPAFGVGDGFALNNPFVLADSIVVVVTRGGARIPTTVNVDYTVTTRGNQTRILVLPTSIVIQPNDPLAISYLYQLPTQASYNTSSQSGTVGADLGWIGLTYNHTQTQAPQVTSGSVTFAGNSTTDTVTGALRGNWNVLTAGLNGVFLNYDSSTLAHKDKTVSAALGYQPFYVFGVNVSVGWSQADYSIPVHRSGNTNGRIDLNFFAPPLLTGYDVLTATVFALRNKLTDSQIPTQTLNQFGGTLNYTLGKLTLAANARYGDFTIGTGTTKGTQFNLSINRRF